MVILHEGNSITNTPRQSEEVLTMRGGGGCSDSGGQRGFGPRGQHCGEEVSGRHCTTTINLFEHFRRALDDVVIFNEFVSFTLNSILTHWLDSTTAESALLSLPETSPF
jgi:hypothetical protein